MSKVIRVALPGYNALTDTSLDHFALKSDDDNVLIKEFSRGTVTLASGASQTIPHNLGYIPFFTAFAYATFIINGSDVTGYLQMSSGGAISVPLYEMYTDTVNAYIVNNSGNSVQFWYFLFYDKQT